jgi:pimeloyl-ACP methyl ester carboxylesterase
MLNPSFKRLPGIRLVHHLVRHWHSFKHYPKEVRRMPRIALEEGIPFFFIQGLKDLISLPTESRWFHDHLIRSPREYWAVPEARHMTIRTLRKEEYRKRVLGFLNRYLAVQLATCAVDADLPQDKLKRCV